MKSTDFKSGHSNIKVLNDVIPQKKKINWDRTIYLVILGLLSAYILFLILKSILFVQGEGQVLFKKLDIQYPDDIQISEILVSEGDTVNIGDTLFSYKLNHVQHNTNISRSTEAVTVVNKTDLSWLEKEIAQTKRNTSIGNLVIQSKMKILRKVLKDIERTKEAILLDIYTIDKLDNLTNRQVQLESEIEAERGEIRLLQSYLKELELKLNEHVPLVISKEVSNPAYVTDLPSFISEQKYISPVKGTITKINKENFEVAMKSEIIMSIHKPANLFIKVFYDQKSLKHVNAGDKVLVVFPDGTLSEGILERFYFATYQLPEELQKKYEPITRSIAADIYPVNNTELEKWKTFYKLNVQIYKWKYW